MFKKKERKKERKRVKKEKGSLPFLFLFSSSVFGAGLSSCLGLVCRLFGAGLSSGGWSVTVWGWSVVGGWSVKKEQKNRK